MEGILGEEFYFEVITNQFLTDIDITRVIQRISIENCIRYEEQEGIRYLQYRFLANQFINLQDLEYQMQLKQISIQFQELTHIIDEVLSAILQYHSMGLNLDSVSKKKIWIRCANPFSFKLNKYNQFQVVLTGAFFNQFIEGQVAILSNYLLVKIKDIIVELYKHFTISDQLPWLKELKNSRNFDILIRNIQSIRTSQHNYAPIQRARIPSDYNLLFYSKALTQMSSFLPANLYNILKSNIIIWIIMQNIPQKWKNLDSLLCALKLENLKLLSDFQKKEKAQAQKLKIHMIQHGYLNSLVNLQTFPNESFFQFQQSLVQQNNISSDISQKQSLIAQLQQIAENYFPKFCQKLASTKFLDLEKIKSILETQIPILQAQISQYNQYVYDKINKSFKLQNFKNAEDFEEQLLPIVFQIIDDQLPQNIDSMVQVFNDQQMTLEIIKKFYTSKVKELNEKTCDKIKFE